MSKLHDERGQSLVEYALLMALVCLAALVLFIPTIIVYQWMRHVRHADRTTSFLFAIGFTVLMNVLSRRAAHMHDHHCHECCDDEAEEDIPNPGCECCEWGCVCPAGDGCCRCSRDGDRDCCARSAESCCDCGDNCDCGEDNCPDCGDLESKEDHNGKETQFKGALESNPGDDNRSGPKSASKGE
jgi:hypothetical protein